MLCGVSVRMFHAGWCCIFALLFLNCIIQANSSSNIAAEAENNSEIVTYAGFTTCQLNEEYLTCGSECPKTCCNYNLTFGCSTKCVIGCFCIDGYVRDPIGNCITPEECPTTEDAPVCGPYEDKPMHGRECERTCTDDWNHVYPPVDNCPCAGGFVRDARGQCVPKILCPQACLGRNEVYDCKYQDTHCVQIFAEPASNMCIPKCYCGNDHARSFYGNCIPNEYCNIYNNPFRNYYEERLRQS